MGGKMKRMWNWLSGEACSRRIVENAEICVIRGIIIWQF